jgi:hypothetical protein
MYCTGIACAEWLFVLITGSDLKNYVFSDDTSKIRRCALAYIIAHADLR